MLQWYDVNWEHRAYWGANLIGWGTDGTTSRQYMGPLPAAGQWVQLAVPAAQVGLEGRRSTAWPTPSMEGVPPGITQGNELIEPLRRPDSHYVSKV